MSDTMEVWQLCKHGEVHEHGYDFDSICPGGKRIVLERGWWCATDEVLYLGEEAPRAASKCGPSPDHEGRWTYLEVSDDE